MKFVQKKGLSQGHIVNVPCVGYSYAQMRKRTVFQTFMRWTVEKNFVLVIAGALTFLPMVGV